ncbi:MAG TPA: response regulator [Candidatus Limnocylindrales bacterium]|nr:response regulator [Candidatus Limnocylindrales bacterium]
MNAEAGRVLVVDDERLNRMVLRRALEADGRAVSEAPDGRVALEILDAEQVDVVLLDLVMPEMDGYQTLAALKANEALGHIPVIIISGVDELGSVVRCIEMGATDYLTKPFEPALLRARIQSSLAAKRLRDLEREYLEQVAKVTGAAEALERGEPDFAGLADVGARTDALGLLARRFASMAAEVKAREERLRAEVRELRIEIDQARQAKKVSEITETDFFRDLRSRATTLRQAVRGDEPPAVD